MRVSRRVLMAAVLVAVIASMLLLIPYTCIAWRERVSGFNCRVCHRGGEGFKTDVVVEGLPREYKPGVRYVVKLRIIGGPPCKPGSSCGGFLVVAEGGHLEVVDARVTRYVAYDKLTALMHTPKGTLRREWVFAWVAPKDGVARIRVAVVAANGDGTPYGDAVVFREFIVYPVNATGAAVVTSREGVAGGVTIWGLASSTLVLMCLGVVASYIVFRFRPLLVEKVSRVFSWHS